ncbi:MULTISPECIES: AAA family ATPase [unclassified Methylobacterium]|uniref:AAA family ATPase n=1 Tax=unclassified Methylobacterium TaxID=2615210 RepID=UPI00226A5CA6|nr:MULTISPECIES: AAA family ATPase [unclassified Methylobacterium]
MSEAEHLRIEEYVEFSAFTPEPDEQAAGGKPAAIRATPFLLPDPRSIPPRRWLYGRHYIRRFTTATIAPGGLGKTSLVLVEALAMVTGKPLLGIRVAEPLRVWVWNGEDPREEVERRLAAACTHYGITAEDIGGRLFIDSGRETPIVIAQKLGEGTTVMRPVVEAVTATILANRIDVMTVDPFISSHAVPENDNGAVDRVAKEWGGIAEAGNCCIGFVHHVRKPGAGQAAYTVEDARGGSSLIGAVRSARVLNGMSSDEAAQAGVEADQRRRFFRVDDGKANMQPPADGASWHELVSVPLGNDTLEYPGDMVGVVTAWNLPSLSDALQPGDVRKVQDAIAAGAWADNVRADNWAGKAAATVLGLDVDDAGDRKRISALLTLWKKNGCLKTDTRHNARTGRDQVMVVVGEVF